MAQDICIFLQETLMTVDAAMVINIFSGLPGMRNMGLAKQHRRSNNPALPYVQHLTELLTSFITAFQCPLSPFNSLSVKTLSDLSIWFSKNGLKVNADETQLIVLGSRQNISRLPPINVKFMGTTVAGSSTVRSLGVVFDQTMTFSAHIDDIVMWCTGTLCGLSLSRHCLPQSTLVRLVEGLVVSVIRYCITVYGCANKTQMSRLQRLLNFGAWVISGRRRYDHISDVLRELGCLTAENMYLYHG